MEDQVIPYVDYSLCVGCGACAELYPLFFVMRDGKAWIMNHDKFVTEEHRNLIYCCPFGALTVE
ncbi:MAG TPA: ferredoxin [Thermodesulfovibrionales bacterium]|nr:ferredoxin [Thermodesulfovibrionales bacterium]